MNGPLRIWPPHWLGEAEVEWERAAEELDRICNEWELEDYRRANGEILDDERGVA